MGSRSTAEVKREIESERERLGSAAETLRTESGSVAKKLAVGVAGAAAVVLAARAILRRGD
jgi:hypothetical protein